MHNIFCRCRMFTDLSLTSLLCNELTQIAFPYKVVLVCKWVFFLHKLNVFIKIFKKLSIHFDGGCIADSDAIEQLKRLRVNVSDFDVKGTIGRGHFGEIQVARERGTSSVYALKIIHKADILSQQNVSHVYQIIFLLRR